MDNVSVWRLCDSDDSDSPDDFNEEDLLIHYQEKNSNEGLSFGEKIFQNLKF